MQHPCRDPWPALFTLSSRPILGHRTSRHQVHGPESLILLGYDVHIQSAISIAFCAGPGVALNLQINADLPTWTSCHDQGKNKAFSRPLILTWSYVPSVGQSPYILLYSDQLLEAARPS